MEWIPVSARNFGFAAVVLSLLTGALMSGCYSPYHYQPQNPYGPGPAMPGGGYGGGFQGGTFPAGPGYQIPGGQQFGVPQGGVPTPVFQDGQPLQPFPDAGFGPSGNAGGAGGLGSPIAPGGNNFLPSTGVPGGSGYDGGNLVPNYGDAPGGTTGGGTFNNENVSPFSPGASLTPPTGNVQVVAHDSVQPPGRLNQQTVQNSVPIHTQATVESSMPNPFDRDPQGYRWLRGVVDYDQVDRAWILFYSAAPETDDPLKGRVVLVDDPRLRNLRDGDVVFVEGRLDVNSRDARSGLPKYRITGLKGPLTTQ